MCLLHHKYPQNSFSTQLVRTKQAQVKTCSQKRRTLSRSIKEDYILGIITPFIASIIQKLVTIYDVLQSKEYKLCRNIKTRIIKHRKVTLINPISLALLRKHCLQHINPYFLIIPCEFPHTRLVKHKFPPKLFNKTQQFQKKLWKAYIKQSKNGERQLTKPVNQDHRSWGVRSRCWSDPCSSALRYCVAFDQCKRLRSNRHV